MLLALEGLDGVGKRTQAEQLARHAQAAGISCAVVSFPRYGQTLHSSTIADYLNGKFGSISLLPPHFAALLYAGDRFESRMRIMELQASVDLLILDRYVGSNLAYQGSRVPIEERDQFLHWIANVEHGVFGLPKADLTIYLWMPTQLAMMMTTRKGERVYTKRILDLNESDPKYLDACAATYADLARRQFFSNWLTIGCVSSDGRIRAVEEIASQVWEATSHFVTGAR